MKKVALTILSTLLVALLCSCGKDRVTEVAGYVRQLAVAPDEREEARLTELIRMNSKGANVHVEFMDGHGQVIDSAAFYRMWDSQPSAKPQLLFIVGSPIQTVASRSFMNRETAKYFLLPQ